MREHDQFCEFFAKPPTDELCDTCPRNPYEKKLPWRERPYVKKKLEEDPHYFRNLNREYRRKNPEKAKLYHDRWLVKHPKGVVKSYTKWRKENPTKYWCKMYALRYGAMQSACEFCDSTENLERHHTDYNRPMYFLTLCKDCHEAEHTWIESIGFDLTVPTSMFESHHCDTCNQTYPECGRGHPSYRGKACGRWDIKERVKQE